MALLCQHVVAHRLTHLQRIKAVDLSISEEGDLVVMERAPTAPLPALSVLTTLLQELLPLVDEPAPELSMLGFDPGGGGNVASFCDAADLGAWMVQAFHIVDTRALLTAVQWPSGPNPVVPSARVDVPAESGRPAPRYLSYALIVLVIGLSAVTIRERAKQETPGWSHDPGLGQAAEENRQADAGLLPGKTIGNYEAQPRGTDESSIDDSVASLVEPATPPAMAVAPASVRVETPGIDGSVFSPSFGNGGSAMFFHSGKEPRAQILEAAIGEADELVEVRALSHDGARNYHVRLSSDEARVAFDSDREGQRAVYVARRDGTDVRRVSGEGYAAVPTWSPDDTRLAFIRAEADRPRVWNLWLVRVASGQLTRLTSHRVGQTWGASWFPGGRRVCYSHEDTLRVLDLDQGEQQRFSSPVHGRLLRTPAVSPDGRRIVFQVQGDGAWMLELGDGSMRRILHDPSAEEFTWHPRGGRIAYHSRRDGEWRIWITAPPASGLNRPPV